jgi:hypothetical protein
VSSVVVATYYFVDKPSFASGFVISGGSLGPTIFQLIIIKLNELYGRSGCFLILGGLILNIIVCGFLFRPLDWELDGYKKKLLNVNVNSRLLSNQTIVSSINGPLDISIVNLKKKTNTISMDYKTKYSLPCPNLSSKSTSNINNIKYHLKKYNHLVHQWIQHKINSNRVRQKPQNEEEDKKVSQDPKQISNILKRFFESIVTTLKLFRKVEFTIFVASSLILNLFYKAPFYFINSYMAENKFSRNQAGVVNVVVGIAGIIGSISYGYIGDIKRLNWILLYSISIYLAALCQVAIPFIIGNYALTMIAMILLSMFICAADVLVPIICVHTVGNDDFVSVSMV